MSDASMMIYRIKSVKVTKPSIRQGESPFWMIIVKVKTDLDETVDFQLFSDEEPEFIVEEAKHDLQNDVSPEGDEGNDVG